MKEILKSNTDSASNPVDDKIDLTYTNKVQMSESDSIVKQTIPQLRVSNEDNLL